MESKNLDFLCIERMKSTRSYVKMLKLEPATDAPSTSVAVPSPQWMIISTDPVTVCKMATCSGKSGKAHATVSINREMEWTIYYLEHRLSSLNCSMFSVLPSRIDNVAVVQQMIHI